MRPSSKSASFSAEPAEPPAVPSAALQQALKRWLNDEAGATAVEYGLFVAFISLAILTAVESVSGALSGVFGKLTTALASM